MLPPEEKHVAGANAPPAYFDEALRDAERLLKYAAEIGIEVDAGTRDAVLTARTQRNKGWELETTSKLLAALTWLAARLKPVTAESLQAYHVDTRSTVNNYFRIALIIACFVVPVSVMSFVASALSTDLVRDIDTANKLAVKLHVQLGPEASAPAAPLIEPKERASAKPSEELDAKPDAKPDAKSDTKSDAKSDTKPDAKSAAKPVKHTAKTQTVHPKPVLHARARADYPAGLDQTEAVTELQDYASIVRIMYDRARKLNGLVFWVEKDPFKYSQTEVPEQARKDDFELTPGLPDMYSDRDRLTSTYQQVRNFAQNLVTDQAVFYGAMTSCLLPVLYALLGTCAYLLRTFEDQMSSRTFTPSVANSARFVMAAIGGAVVGLFNNYVVSTHASLSPLAIAFLVGYSVDVFFAFLEGLMKSFSKSTAPTLPAPPSAPAVIEKH